MNIEGPTVSEIEQEQPTTETQTSEAEVVDPKDTAIEELASQRDHLKDQLLRVMAEAQNVQKRLRQQMEDDRKFASQSLVERLLPVLDSFERSLTAAERGASFDALIDGVRAVDKQLRQALESVNVSRIDSVGIPYDPEVHEAVAAHVTAEVPEDTVTDEIEAGYKMHHRVIRPAKVRVAKKP